MTLIVQIFARKYLKLSIIEQFKDYVVYLLFGLIIYMLYYVYEIDFTFEMFLIKIVLLLFVTLFIKIFYKIDIKGFFGNFK